MRGKSMSANINNQQGPALRYKLTQQLELSKNAGIRFEAASTNFVKKIRIIHEPFRTYYRPLRQPTVVSLS